jgi:ribosome-binding factor A
MASERTRARIAARINARGAYCIEFELSDPRAGFITITEVEVASDLTSAKVKYSVLGTPSEQRQVQHMLQRAAGFVQRQVSRVLQTRTVPRLSFIYDDSLEVNAAMDATIHQALERDRLIRGESEPDPSIDVTEAEPQDEPSEG